MGLRSVLASALRGAIDGAQRSLAPQPVATTPTEPTKPTWSNFSLAHESGPAEKPYAAVLPRTYDDWQIGDDVRALYLAEQSRLQFAVQLCEAISRDGVAKGLLTTRSAGLLSLPLEITGPSCLVKKLGGQDRRSGLFWKMFPHAALSRILMMGILLGAGIGYFVDVDGVPVLHVIEHQWLYHIKDPAGTWHVYYQVADGPPVEVIPGDGRWFVFAPWGWERFWIYGAVWAVGKFYIAKRDAVGQRNTWGTRLARGIINITAPVSSSTAERTDLVDYLASIVAPPVIAVLEGWKLETVDVTGHGFEVWKDAKTDANDEIRMALSGQLVTSGGQTLGFGSGNIFADIAKTFIANDAAALAETIHYHGLVPFAIQEGEDPEDAPWAEWDTIDPKEKEVYATALKSFGESLSTVAKGYQDFKASGAEEKISLSDYADKIGIDQVSSDKDDEQTEIVSGIKVRIEYPEGSLRTGVGANGLPWSTLMAGASYGEIIGTEGADGEAIDCYVGPFGDAREAYVLEQLDFYGRLDEHKVFLGFYSLSHAQETYRRLANPDCEGAWLTLPAEFIAGLVDPERPTLPAVEQASEDAPSLPVASQEESTGVESEGPIDPPTNEEAEQLAAYMTEHKLDRCEHGRVNECERCGVERVRGGVVDVSGKHVGWKIAWRARRQQPKSEAA